MDIPAAQVEQLIVNRFYNKQYMNLIMDAYDERFFDNKNLSICLKLLISLYKKYDKIPSEQSIYMVISKYCTSKEKSNSKTLISEFKTCISLTIEDEELVKANMVEYLQNKAMYYAVMDGIESIENFEDIAIVREKFDQITNIGIDDELGFDYFNDQEEHWNQICNPDSKLSTGFRDLDDVLNGGFFKEGHCLAVFMAEAHMGKSLMLSNIAVNLLKQNKFVVIITLEMSELMYGMRIDSHISNEDINSLHVNPETTQQKIKDFREMYPEGKLLLKEYPTDSISANHIKAYIEKIISITGRKPDAILVDYINLLLPARKISVNAGSYERVGSICKQLRALSCKPFDMPFISVTQSNREGYGSTDIQMKNSSDSIDIPRVVDFLASLWQQDGDREAGILRSTILKNRIGGRINRVIQYNIDYQSLRITDAAQHENFDRNVEENVLSDLNEL